jgi:hypothetical protein
VDDLDADLATEEELALIEAELAAEGEEPVERPPSVPRGPAVEVRPIISIGAPEPLEPPEPPMSLPPPPRERTGADDEVMVCAVCGAEALVGNRFCVECGTRHAPHTAAVVRRSDLPGPTDGTVDVELEASEPGFDDYDEVALDDAAEETSSASPPVVPGVVSFCHHCGTRVVEDYEFCVQCGARLFE